MRMRRNGYGTVRVHIVRFWNVLVLPFRSRTVRKGTVPFTLCLATVPELWERSRRCSVNGILQTMRCKERRDVRFLFEYQNFGPQALS